MFFYKGDCHKKKLKKGLGLALIVSFLLSVAPQPALAEGDAGLFGMFRNAVTGGDDPLGDPSSDPIGYSDPKTYGNFKNVTNTVTIDPESAGECQRTMSGITDFTWPKNKNFKDVVIIYDLDAPDSSTREIMKDIVRNIAKQLEFGSEQVGTSNTYYPKDRIMAVYYGGNQGRVKLGREGERETTVKSYPDIFNVRHKLQDTNLYTSGEDIENLIQNFLIESSAWKYYENHFSSPLPALIEAKSAYGRRTRGN